MKSNFFIAKVESLYYLFNPNYKTAKVTCKNDKKWENAEYVIGDLVIPGKVNFGGFLYDVTEICDYAFYGCNQLRSVSIPDSMTEIGSNAFDDCRALELVLLPDLLSNIGEQAFWGCSSLHTINIPRGLSAIKYQTFGACPALKSVKIPFTINPNQISDDAFDTGTELIFENGSEQIGTH